MSLLIPESPIAYLPTLARRTSVAAAILAQQIYYWQTRDSGGLIHDGERWIFKSYKEWAEETALTFNQVRDAISLLEERGMLKSKQLRAAQRDQTKFYRICTEHEAFCDPAEPVPTTGSDDNSIWATAQLEMCHSTTGDVPQHNCLKEQRLHSETTDRETPLPPPDAQFVSPYLPEGQALAEMRKWRGYPYDQQKDLQNMRDLRDEFTLTEQQFLTICKDLTAWLESKPKEKGSRARLRNFCKPKPWQSGTSSAPNSRPSYSSGPPEGFDYPHIEFDQGGGK